MNFMTAVIVVVGVGLAGMALQGGGRVTKNAKQPVIRISKGRFAPEKYLEVKRLIDESAAPLVPAIRSLADSSTTTPPLTPTQTLW